MVAFVLVMLFTNSYRRLERWIIAFVSLIGLSFLVQLPWTIFTQVRLTSSKAVMGKYANTRTFNMALWATALVVTALNVALLWSFLPK